jgi:hemoglobin-like flavoprotein
MSLDAALLKQSFVLVLERAPDLTARFYDVLFDRYPKARPLFSRNPRGRQEQMLAGALSAVIDHLEDASWLTEQLAALGAKHVAYGVRAEMYDWVGDALLTSLAAAAGPDWNDELRAQWTEAYGAIVSLMRAGESLSVVQQSVVQPGERADVEPVSAIA